MYYTKHDKYLHQQGECISTCMKILTGITHEDFVLQFLQRCRLLSGLRIKSLKTALTVLH